MNNCYKCGRDVANGVECDPPCYGNQPEDDGDYEQALKEYEAKTVPIDWDKVTTLEDLKLVVKTLVCEDRVFPDSDEYQVLKHLLRSNPERKL